MMRLLPAFAALALVACSSQPTGVPERDLQWRTSLQGQDVRVTVFDRTGAYHIDRIVLVGPDGNVVPARETTRENQGSGGIGPGIGVFGSGGSRGGAGIGMGIDVPIGSDPASLERRTSAVIPVPPGYRENPARWHVEIEMTVPGDGPYRASLPAPAS